MPSLTQAQVNYRRGFAADQCGKCSMYTHGSNGGQYGRCTLVTGQITPYGVCDRLERLVNPFGRLAHHQRVAHMHAQLQQIINNPY